MICGSMQFSKEMLDAKNELEKLGHEAIVPGDISDCLRDPNLDYREEDYEKNLRYCIERNLLEDALKKVEESDAVLVYNPKKNDVEGYIGAAALMALGVAFHLGKKIYLFNEVDKSQRYSVEVGLAQPIVLAGDYSKVS